MAWLDCLGHRDWLAHEEILVSQDSARLDQLVQKEVEVVMGSLESMVQMVSVVNPVKLAFQVFQVRRERVVTVDWLVLMDLLEPRDWLVKLETPDSQDLKELWDRRVINQ